MVFINNDFGFFALDLVEFIDHLLEVFGESDFLFAIQKHGGVFGDVEVKSQWGIFRGVGKGNGVSEMGSEDFVDDGEFVFVSEVKDGGSLLIGFGESIVLLHFGEFGAEAFDEGTGINEGVT